MLLFPFATALVAAHECGHWLFLRADLYAVLVAATGCHNLWRAKILSLRRALKSLTLAQVGELATLHSRDVAVAAWFGWLWLAGFPAAGVWFAWFMCWYWPASSPGRVRGLMASPATGRFWLAIGCGAILGRRFGTPAVLIVRSAATSSTLLGRKGRPGTIKRPHAHATS